MQQHAATFFAQAEDAAGADLPRFVKDELDAFLECGILDHGFLRLRCDDRGHDKLVAFSCKRRGFCLSCNARRMAQTAAHLVDHVSPMCRCASGCSLYPWCCACCAVTLIHCFGSAANLHIHLPCLVLDGVYRLRSTLTPTHCAS